MITLDAIQTLIHTRFQGRLWEGAHAPDGHACVLECYSQALGLDWTDDPSILRIWDVRPINDIPVSPEQRAQRMPALVMAYQGCCDWPRARQKAVAARLAMLTVQRIIAALPGLPDDVAHDCRTCERLSAAKAGAAAAMAALAAQAAQAAKAAASAADGAAARAACAAALAAQAAKAAAAAADVAAIFEVACDLWLEAARA
jgi:hypothetical protein